MSCILNSNMDFSGTYDLYGVVAPTAMVANYVVFNVPFRTQDYNIVINTLYFQNMSDNNVKDDFEIFVNAFSISLWSRKDYQLGVRAMYANITLFFYMCKQIAKIFHIAGIYFLIFLYISKIMIIFVF